MIELFALYLAGAVAAFCRSTAVANHYRKQMPWHRATRTDIIFCLSMAATSWIGWLLVLDGPPSSFKHEFKLIK